VAGRLLRIYLNDQLALGILWREVAQRATLEPHRLAAGQEALGGR
jgi:hypothetical protein